MTWSEAVMTVVVLAIAALAAVLITDPAWLYPDDEETS